MEIASLIIPGISFCISLFIFFMAIVTLIRVKDHPISWAIKFLLLAGLLFSAHTFIELYDLGGGPYGTTALLSAIFLAFVIVTLDIVSKSCGEKHE